MSEFDSNFSKQRILDLFVRAGYIGVRNTSISAADLLTEGLAWCIAAAATTTTNPNCSELGLLSAPNIGFKEDKSEVLDVIEAALRSMGCPYPLQIDDLDYNGIYPVVQWVVDRIPTTETKNKDEVIYAVPEIEREEHIVKQLQKELDDAKHSIKKMNANINEQNLKKIHILNEMQDLRAKIDKEGDKGIVEELTLLLESSKDIKKKESDFRSSCKLNQSNLQADVVQLEKKISSYNEDKGSSDDFKHFLFDRLENLNSAKSDLAVKSREVISLKRQLDDVPSQSELIQYERRSSELYVQIQEKLRQTRKYYATYNTLLEIKELVLKETSLLNSIISQYTDAITNPAGRMKLIDSMEGIVKGTEQKLVKVQLGLQYEQKLGDALKEKYDGSITEQRKHSSLLKALQEEYTKNEKLRRQTST